MNAGTNPLILPPSPWQLLADPDEAGEGGDKAEKQYAAPSSPAVMRTPEHEGKLSATWSVGEEV